MVVISTMSGVVIAGLQVLASQPGEITLEK
jgi:hypothetical protein